MGERWKIDNVIITVLATSKEWAFIQKWNAVIKFVSGALIFNLNDMLTGLEPVCGHGYPLTQ